MYSFNTKWEKHIQLTQQILPYIYVALRLAAITIAALYCVKYPLLLTLQIPLALCCLLFANSLMQVGTYFLKLVSFNTLVLCIKFPILTSAAAAAAAAALIFTRNKSGTPLKATGAATFSTQTDAASPPTATQLAILLRTDSTKKPDAAEDTATPMSV